MLLVTIVSALDISVYSYLTRRIYKHLRLTYMSQKFSFLSVGYYFIPVLLSAVFLTLGLLITSGMPMVTYMSTPTVSVRITHKLHNYVCSYSMLISIPHILQVSFPFQKLRVVIELTLTTLLNRNLAYTSTAIQLLIF